MYHRKSPVDLNERDAAPKIDNLVPTDGVAVLRMGLTAGISRKLIRTRPANSNGGAIHGYRVG
jgi:hypothetical protein